MATNRRLEDGRYLHIDAGTSLSSGDIAVVNDLVGIAQYDTDTDNKTVIDTAGVYDLSVYAHDGSSNSKVNIGNIVYADEGNNRCDKDATNPIAGIALEAVTSGSTSTIKVLLAPGNLTNLSADSVTNTYMAPKYMKVATVALSSGSTNAYALAWQNPEDAKILVHRVMLDITTAGGGSASTIDVGTAADGTTNSDNLIDGGALSSIAVLDNIDDQGTNGESKQKMDENGGTTDYITGQILDNDASSLAGYAYIFYTEVQ